MKTDHENHKISIAGKKILIVDDNFVLRSLLTDYLESFNAHITQADNGKKGLALVKQNVYDIILSDIKMPIMTGIEFIQNIPLKNNNTIKIIMSGEASIEDVISSFKEKIDEFIIKPFPSLEIIRQAIERQLLKQTLRKDLLFKNQIVKHYNEILHFLVSNSDLKKTFQFIFKSIKKLIPVNQMELVLFDSDQKALSKKYIINDSSFIVPPSKPIQPKLIELIDLQNNYITNETIKNFCKANSSLFFYEAWQSKMASSITFLLTVRNKKYGFISFFSNTTNKFSRQNESILKGIVPEISVSVERAIYEGQLYEENSLLRSTTKELNNQILSQQDALIFSLAELAEKRDLQTGKHLLRIQAYSKTLAKKYFNSKDTFDIGYGSMDANLIVEMIEKSSPLHDIGKVGVPDSVLLKDGRLNKKEFEIIKQHTRIGAECLKNAANKVYNNDFLKVSMDIALSHHEKWNGKGYPEGKKGTDIPISARIVALIDVFDALRSPRVYKKAWSFKKVCKHILAEKGRHFDPKVVESFWDIKDEIEAIYTHLKD